MVLLIMLLLSAGTLCAADSIAIRTNYYAVGGGDLQAVREDIARKRPWKEEQDGFTRWTVTWSFTTRDSRSACSIDTIQTKTDITITLPRWTVPVTADESMRASWQRYLTALAAHEDGHKRIALAAAAEVRKRISQTKPAADCAAMEQSINREAKKGLDQFVEREKAYDERTDHGRKPFGAPPANR
jgi:predicted secreted Zn-dependent protease